MANLRLSHLLSGGAAGALMLCSLPAASYAQSVGEASNVDEIVVTGTHLSGRTVTTSPVPIDVLSGETMRLSGHSETADILKQLAPSFSFATPTTPDGNTHIRSASLRGLAPDATLVLVNGRRVHSSAWVNTSGTIGKGAAPTDLNQIPGSAIGRIEILRDGAAAQYGADAIAGVINILLREDTGIHGTVGYGATQDGGGDNYELSLGGGFSLPNDGVLHVTGYYRDHTAANRARPDTRQQYFGIAPNGSLQPLGTRYGSGLGLSAPGGVAGTTLDPREATIDRTYHRFADSADLTDINVIANLVQPISDDLEAYGFASYRVSEGSSNAFARRPGQDENVRAIYPNGFLPFLDTKSNDYNLSGGLRGAFDNGWAWDLNTTYGGNGIEYRTRNTVNATLGATSPTAFYNGEFENSLWVTDLKLSRDFDIGLHSPVSVAVGAAYRRDTYQITAGEPASYALGTAVIPDGPSAGNQPVIGSQGFVGIQPIDEVDVDRSNVGLFAEVNAELSDRLIVTAAARFENFSDFGDALTGQLATRYDLGGGFGWRASVSNAFHAPALAQQYYGSSVGRGVFNNTTRENDFVLVKLAPVGTDLARALGATELTPEESLNVSTGLTFARGGLSVSIDYYRVDIDDRIVLSSNYVDGAGSTRLRDYLTSIGQPGVLSVRYFTNAIDTKTEGVDLAASYRTSLRDLGFADWGQLRLTAAYNYNTTEVTRIADTPDQIRNLGITTRIFDIAEQTRLERGSPRDKVALGANWSYGRFTVDLRGTRFGEVHHAALLNQTAAAVTQAALGATPIRVLPTQGGAAGNFDVIQVLEPRWVTDLSVTYAVTDNVDFTVGANNLFNVYPTGGVASTPTLVGADSSGIFPYSEYSPFGFHGAQFYGRLSVNF